MSSRSLASPTDPLQPLRTSNGIIFADGKCSNKAEIRENPPVSHDRALMLLISDSVIAPFELPLKGELLQKGIRRLADAVSRRSAIADLKHVPGAVRDRLLALLAEAAAAGTDHTMWECSHG